ncbi:hypothetical protein JG688_00011994, partial [Phytophthora aleatoria]
GGDNADLRSSNQGVCFPGPTCGDKGTPLAENAASSATIHQLGSAEIDATEVGTHSVNDSAETLRLYYLVAASADEGEGGARELGDLDQFEHEGTDFDFADYAHELAFLSVLAAVVPTEHDYDASNIKSSCHTPEHSARLVEVLRTHGLIILSGNALPPAAYGVVCVIDVQGHAPIKQ